MKKAPQDSIRTFIAVELPEDIRMNLARLQDGLRELMPDVRWTKSENIHLTLKFLGNIQTSMIERIAEELILKVSKEIAVKFIEVGRLTPATFETSFQKIYNTVKQTVDKN